MCPVRNEKQFLIAEGRAIAGFAGVQREGLPALRCHAGHKLAVLGRQRYIPLPKRMNAGI